MILLSHFRSMSQILRVFSNALGKDGVPLYEEQMVENLLDQIMSPNTELKTEVNIFRSSHLSTFSKHSLTCLQWLKDSIRLPTLHQGASESVVFVLLFVETVAA